MTDEPALLAAIADRPDDDTPRLVYADWLDDHGQRERAEFIRLQCALARDDVDDPAAAERADELEGRDRRKWLSEVFNRPGFRWEFIRGFPERLETKIVMALARFLRLGGIPWLRDLCLTDVTGSSLRDFVSRHWPGRWESLELWGGAGDDTVWPLGVLAYSPQAAQLRALRIGGVDVTDDAVEALASSPYLAGLRLLSLPGDRDRPRYAALRRRFGDRLVGEGV
jgi:uncharacterized protein (TIGR02996 family)